MGYELYREVKVWAPDALTKGEKLAALVIADNADDRTRLSRDSVVDPELMAEAMVPDDRAMRRIIAKLQEHGVIEHVGGGHNGRTAKFKILRLAPAGWVGTTGYRKRSEVAGWKSPANDDGAASGQEGENRPPTDGVAGRFSAGSRVKTTRPKPPTNQTTTSAPPDPPATATEGGGGGVELEQAEHFLGQLPGGWGCGRRSARKFAPLLLERIHEQGWRLDDDLARELTKNPGGIGSFEAVLPGRIDNLRKRATTKTRDSPASSSLPRWCESEDCNPTTRYRTTDTDDGPPVSAPCRHCHPDMIKDAAA